MRRLASVEVGRRSGWKRKIKPSRLICNPLSQGFFGNPLDMNYHLRALTEREVRWRQSHLNPSEEVQSTASDRIWASMQIVFTELGFSTAMILFGGEDGGASW